MLISKSITNQMQKLFLTLSSFLILALSAQAQNSDKQKLPSVNVKNLKGQIVSTSGFGNDGHPYVVNFWATWCKPCVLELNTINEVYDDWKEETKVKIIAISTDDARNSAKVAPFVNGKSWEYEVYIDENGDLKRALNVTNVPHTFLFNGKGELVWQHNGYSPGDEDELLTQIKKISPKK